jgi:Holliday junction resolvasome RuvABC endonuclease subunit
MPRVLGLDASTNTIGICVLDFTLDGKFDLVTASYYKPPKKGHPIERLGMTKLAIEKIIEKYQPDHIALEDIILFMKGKSTAKTTTSLAALNRTVGLAVYEKTNNPPILLNVLTIRHAIKDKEVPDKDKIPDTVAGKLNIKFPWILNKNQKPIIENYDMADGMAVALAYACLTINTKGIFPIEKESSIKKEKKKKKKKSKLP